MSATDTSPWPLTTAGGLALLLFGVVAGLPFAAGGAVCLALGIGGWIAQLRTAAAAGSESESGKTVASDGE